MESPREGSSVYGKGGLRSPAGCCVDALGRLECPLFLCGGCAISAISALIPEVGIFGASGGGPNGGGAATSAAGLGLTADEAQGL
jgi:hypothetical protein